MDFFEATAEFAGDQRMTRSQVQGHIAGSLVVVEDGIVEAGGVVWTEGRVAVVGKVVAPAIVSIDGCRDLGSRRTRRKPFSTVFREC